METGVKIFLAGAGPGSADLLTVRLARLLARADIILHDSLIGPDVLALARPEAELIDVGKRCGGKAHPQAEICRLLV
ncbi:MAG TPA: SAM-dependent methyltransferase, partial [Acidocella sp.]|nr:SAM-dependent methyltransferase [Acidocella sp.]